MSTIAANDAKETLAELVRKSETGDDPVIVNRGEPLAHLVPAQSDHDVEQARMAMQRIRERAKRMNLKVTPEEIKAWIEEGRP
jgi:prevent-host-death family protein